MPRARKAITALVLDNPEDLLNILGEDMTVPELHLQALYTSNGMQPSYCYQTTRNRLMPLS